MSRSKHGFSTKREGSPESVPDELARRLHAPLVRIENYWNELRGSRLFPLRSEIDPRRLRGALRFSFDLERDAPGVATFRVAGSHLAELAGRDLREMPISTLLSEDSLEDFDNTLIAVSQTPATASILLRSQSDPETLPRHAHMNLLPMGHESGAAPRVMGALVCDGYPSGTPCVFDIDTIVLNPVVPDDWIGRSAFDRMWPNALRPCRMRRAG